MAAAAAGLIAAMIAGAPARAVPGAPGDCLMADAPDTRTCPHLLPEVGVEAAGPCPAGARSVRPGTDLAALARAAGPGAQFCLGSGIHRLQAITPRDGQVFHGEPGAVLSGARLVTGFVAEGGAWVAAGQTQHGARRADVPCRPGMPRCGYPEAVFVDDVPQRAAGSRAELAPGRFFLDYDTGRLYLGSDPGGRRVEASVAPYAFAGRARGVVIQGLVVEKYATPVQTAAIGAGDTPPDWLVRNNEIRLNATVGVKLGSASRVQRNRIVDNGNMGLGCVGDDILVEENEFARNGGFAGIDTGWEGGAAKCAKTTRLVVRRNYSHHNAGNGFWTDIDNVGTLYQENRIAWNDGGGIVHEISYAAVIRDNLLIGNGDAFHPWLFGAGIQIQNARDVEITGNRVVTYEGNGIALMQQARGTGAQGPWKTVNNRVIGNTLIALVRGRGISGAIADDDKPGMQAGGNVFDRNTYQGLDPAAPHWAWVDAFYDWTSYRRRSAQDGGSSVQPLTGAWAAAAAPGAPRGDR